MTVKEFIRNVPIPVCGLALGAASLDRFLIQNYDHDFSIFVFISAILVILFTMKVVMGSDVLRKELESPVLFGVLPTYPMAIMILCVHLMDFSDVLAKTIWIVSLASMFLMMPFFVRKFVLGFDIRKVFPSWFVMFIGCVVSSVTSVAIGFADVGKLIFLIGLVSYAALLPLILYRVVRIRGIPEPAIPNLAIFAAPPNLLLVGYLSAYGAGVSDIAVGILAAMGIVSYIAVLLCLPFMMKKTFYPSYGAFTFPLVISMVSMRMIGTFYGWSDGIYEMFETATMVIATVMVVYVLIRYLIFFRGIATRTSGSE